MDGARRLASVGVCRFASRLVAELKCETAVAGIFFRTKTHNVYMKGTIPLMLIAQPNMVKPIPNM